MHRSRLAKTGKGKVCVAVAELRCMSSILLVHFTYGHSLGAAVYLLSLVPAMDTWVLPSAASTRSVRLLLYYTSENMQQPWSEVSMCSCAATAPASTAPQSKQRRCFSVVTGVASSSGSCRADSIRAKSPTRCSHWVLSIDAPASARSAVSPTTSSVRKKCPANTEGAAQLLPLPRWQRQ